MEQGAGQPGEAKRGVAGWAGHWQETPHGPVHGVVAYLQVTASQAGEVCICEHSSPQSSQEDRPTSQTHKIRQVVWGRGHPTPCKRATHSCEGWVLDPAQRACAGQLLSTQARGKAPGSSLVKVCQRSRAVSG